jgi:ATP-dependent Lon protease
MPGDVIAQFELLKEKLTSSQVPEDLKARILDRLSRVERIGASQAAFDEVDRTSDYIDWLTKVPWETTSEDILDLDYAKKILDKNHYGLEGIKDRILEQISILKLNKDSTGKARAPILCLVGLAGTGKTTIAYSIAEALGKKFVRIALGGLGETLELRGLSKVHPEAEPGRIVKALVASGVKNPVILLDEIDRVDEKARASVMGVLLELLDPEQNKAFLDYYVDYSLDLSEVVFITTGNNTTNIATAVLDRLEVIPMPSYTDEEKIQIGKAYMLPKVLRESGLPENTVTLDDAVWPSIVRPLGFDSGMRTLERTIQGVVRKVAREVVEGKIKQIKLSSDNIKPYLPA